MKDRLRSIGRRDLLKIFGGAMGLSVFGGTTWVIESDANREREEDRLKTQKELDQYKFEVRVWRGGVVPGAVSVMPPVVEPARLVVEVDTFLTKDRPTTETDSHGVVHMSLGSDVLRYNPNIVRRPPFPYESLPNYEIINPENIGVIERFPQK